MVRAMAIPALKRMLTSGTETEIGVANCIAALDDICAVPEGRDSAVAAGVPAAVVTAMAACNNDARSHAASVLSKMCVHARVRV